MLNWMILPYRRFAEFSGRSRRREFWLFALFCWLVTIAIDIVFGTTQTYRQEDMFVAYSAVASSTAGKLTGLFNLINLVPSLAVSVRRLHDQDRSGWLLLLLLIPFLGWFALLVLFCLDGTRGNNRFGPDPKNPAGADVFT